MLKVIPFCAQGDSTLKVAGQTVEVDRKLGRHLKTLLKVPSWLTQLVSFKTQQIMLGSTWNKMIAVFAIGIPACVVGGVFYSLASGRDILTGFIQAYGALYKIPGELGLYLQCNILMESARQRVIRAQLVALN